ncbi:MAG: signal recognition particle-docking protein FtsY, partial [Candidatus Micrarchaeota archaeon]
AEKHGERLGVRVIKHEYGADPTAVAFDAVNYARAHNIDVVLIDSAGRQETNRNLIDEMKKLSRVIQPDLKIFIGESIAGNALVSQVKSFSEAVGLDGVILTKLDCDAKGGTALSLSKATGVPILYFGIGQAYSDLIPFSAEFVVDQILG